MAVQDVSGRFGAWIDEHFDFVGDPRELQCRRCRKVVGYPTKHAVVRHGDPIRIMPITGSRLGVISAANAF